MADHDYDVDFLDQLLAEADANLDVTMDHEEFKPEPINIRDLLPLAAEAYIQSKAESNGAVAELEVEVEVEVETETPDYFAVMVWEMLTNSCPALSKVEAIEKYHHPDINEFRFRMHCSTMIVVARKMTDDNTFWWEIVDYSFVDETSHPDF